MNIKVNQDNTRIESLSSDKIVDIIYQNIKNNDIHDSSKLSGFVQINHGWNDLIDFFTNKIGNLISSSKSITSTYRTI